MEIKLEQSIEDLLPYKELEDEQMGKILSDHLPKLDSVPISNEHNIKISRY